jgi:hypothetical protein
MRTHGFPQFPDVQAGGGVPIEHTNNGGTDIIINGVGQPVNAPALNTAMAKCARYMVNVGSTAVSNSQVGRINHALLLTAECMRSHDVPQFPDPVPPSRQSGHMNPIAQAKAAGINIYSPAFKAAHEICGSSLRAAMNSG